MKTKTFKIGEYAKGGIITVEIHGKIISIIGKNWDTSKGYAKNSDQSGAKEFTRGTTDSTCSNAEGLCFDFLCDLTTVYYADKVMNWIKQHVKFQDAY